MKEQQNSTTLVEPSEIRDFSGKFEPEFVKRIYILYRIHQDCPDLYLWQSPQALELLWFLYKQSCQGQFTRNRDIARHLKQKGLTRTKGYFRMKKIFRDHPLIAHFIEIEIESPKRHKYRFKQTYLKKYSSELETLKSNGIEILSNIPENQSALARLYKKTYIRQQLERRLGTTSGSEPIALEMAVFLYHKEPDEMYVSTRMILKHLRTKGLVAATGQRLRIRDYLQKQPRLAEIIEVRQDHTGKQYAYRLQLTIRYELTALWKASSHQLPPPSQMDPVTRQKLIHFFTKKNLLKRLDLPCLRPTGSPIAQEIVWFVFQQTTKSHSVSNQAIYQQLIKKQLIKESYQHFRVSKRLKQYKGLEQVIHVSPQGSGYIFDTRIFDQITTEYIALKKRTSGFPKLKSLLKNRPEL